MHAIHTEKLNVIYTICTDCTVIYSFKGKSEYSYISSSNLYVNKVKCIFSSYSKLNMMVNFGQKNK